MRSPTTKPKPRPAAPPRARHRLTPRLLLGAALGFSTASASAQMAPLRLTTADRTLVGEVDAYLNDQRGLTASFLQVADDGSTRTGKAWFQRPGRMRFAYSGADAQLLVAGFGILTYYDPQLNQTSNIPTSSTPLGILLAKHVDLDSPAITITAIEEQPGEDDITLIRKDKPQAGTLTLVFGTDPIELEQWIVTDAQGRQTRVHLYDITPGGPYPDALFQFTPPASNLPAGG